MHRTVTFFEKHYTEISPKRYNCFVAVRESLILSCKYMRLNYINVRKIFFEAISYIRRYKLCLHRKMLNTEKQITKKNIQRKKSVRNTYDLPCNDLYVSTV